MNSLSKPARLCAASLLLAIALGLLAALDTPVTAADAPKSNATNAPKSNPNTGKGTNANKGGAAPKSSLPTQTWTGTWNNRKFNTTGTLNCTIVGEQGGQWMARFTGTGLGRPFNYIALITARRNGNVTTLQGSNKVDGDTYQWTGSINGKAMVGSFRSGTGNNGEFRLQEK